MQANIPYDMVSSVIQRNCLSLYENLDNFSHLEGEFAYAKK